MKETLHTVEVHKYTEAKGIYYIVIRLDVYIVYIK